LARFLDPRGGPVLAEREEMPDNRGIVLVVDDDQDWIEMMSDFLAEEGYSVVVAADGVAALNALSQTNPFAVVTDIQMPIMDGRQLLSRIHEQDARVPVIVISGEIIQSHDTSLEGAFQVIRKPVPARDLLAALSAAKTHRADHLPLHKLWAAAGSAARAQASPVPLPRWEALRRLAASLRSSVSAPQLVMFTLALASSVVLFKLCRTRLS
jgi:CheY-like chemotaxis protein